MGLIALIPARGGSKRIPSKNIRNFFGHPLIAYTIQSAIDSKIFDWIYVSTDSDEIGQISAHYGANWIRRPEEFARDGSPDIEWIIHALQHSNCDAFMILRPTSPFRTVETIKRAFRKWDKEDCMKAIQKVSEHPSKMWEIQNPKKTEMIPMMMTDDHLLPIQSLREIYIQNACIEIRPKKISDGIQWPYQPFFTEAYEGFDLNDMNDWILAEALVERGIIKLTEIERKPWAEK